MRKKWLPYTGALFLAFVLFTGCAPADDPADDQPEQEENILNEDNGDMAPNE